MRMESSAPGLDTKMKSHQLGKKGESLACRYIKKKGYKILSTNYYCRYGELDIVACDMNTIVFIEVKSRTDPHGFEQAIGWKKRRSLHRSALSYLQQNRLHDRDFRFVACFVCFPEGNAGPAILHWLEDPF